MPPAERPQPPPPGPPLATGPGAGRAPGGQSRPERRQPPDRQRHRQRTLGRQRAEIVDQGRELPVRIACEDEVKIVRRHQAVVRDAQVDLGHLGVDLRQVDQRRLDRHHGNRHERLKRRLDGDLEGLGNLGRRHRPDVLHRFAREEGLRIVGQPRLDQRRSVETDVFVRRRINVVVAFGQLRHDELAVGIRDAVGQEQNRPARSRQGRTSRPGPRRGYGRPTRSGRRQRWQKRLARGRQVWTSRPGSRRLAQASEVKHRLADAAREASSGTRPEVAVIAPSPRLGRQAQSPTPSRPTIVDR